MNKSIYGLKQSAKAWYEKLKSVLISLGFKASETDPCLFKSTGGDDTIYIIIHIDDMVIASKSNKTVETLKTAINEKFKIVDLGELSLYLGITVRRDEEGYVYISQSSYIKRIIDRSRLTDPKISKYPLDVGYEKLRADSKPIQINYYQKLIGALLYVAVNTRPDISAAVSILSRHIKDTKEIDWLELKRVCRYLKYTIKYELKLSNGQTEERELIG